MNEQLQGKLVEILSAIQDAAKATGDFAMRELPDVAQSYLMYGRISSTFEVVFWLAIVGTGVYVTKRMIPWAKKEYSEPALAVPVILTGLAALMCVGVIRESLLVWLAPKVWLLKEIASLIK